MREQITWRTTAELHERLEALRRKEEAAAHTTVSMQQLLTRVVIAGLAAPEFAVRRKRGANR